MRGLTAVTKEMLADLDTPVSAYLKLCAGEADSFLFESGEGRDSLGRYSIVAWDPLLWLELRADEVRLWQEGQASSHPPERFFALARRYSTAPPCPGLPPLPFAGSLVGFVGYEAVRLLERLPRPLPGPGPLARLCLCSRLVVFDHLLRRLTLVVLDRSQEQARAKLAQMEKRLQSPLDFRPRPGRVRMSPPPRQRYLEMVERAQEYIREGEIFQVVLAERFQGRGRVDPLFAYRWLRASNPSPYMFFLDLGEIKLAGASPETMVKVSQGTVHLRPIAGTRGRSSDPAEDRRLAWELMASEKERAEHVMLVDLARNDAGRVCDFGSIKVDPLMVVERFSHVMHLVSRVQGRLRPGLDAWDAFMAAFPAGTVSGAPKVRAMEIIDELEPGPRGAYAGAVGRFGPGPEMDTCIAIRMIQFQDQQVVVQVGAGIVADSEPEMEYQEITQKAAQGLAALEAAGEERP